MKSATPYLSFMRLLLGFLSFGTAAATEAEESHEDANAAALQGKGGESINPRDTAILPSNWGWFLACKARIPPSGWELMTDRSRL